VHSAEIYLERATLPANGQKFPDVWPMVCDAANAVCERWREPDEGLWESRIGRRHFTYSKAMCWLALDAAIRIGGRHRAEVPHRWIGEARRVRRFLEHRCVDPQLHCFVQAAGDTEIDASILRLPLLRVIRADDPRMLATVRTIESRLMENGLVLRNRNLEGAQKGEGAFLPCTLWLAANYAMAGRLRHAERLIERVAGCANDLGLLAEEADPSSGELLGNFPQAFTHLALIHAAQLHRRARQGAFQSARTA
jgi:GH15 family glucan-1,4-alpha-glucosidase